MLIRPGPTSSRPIRRGVAVLAALLAAALASGAAEGREPEAAPRTAAELYQTTRVWTVHLRLTPEQWAALEPAGGNPGFDMAGFGLGMFLAPPMLRAGDVDQSQSLSAPEFRELADRWFTAWDQDGDGRLDSPQLRAGLKAALAPPPAPATGAADQGWPPPGFQLQGREGKRNGLSSILGIEFAQVHADLEFAGQSFPNVAVRYKGNGTFLESRSSLKRPLKIDLNKYVKGQKFAGVTTLNLHNNVTDAGMMNEAISFQLYREEQVPAPRTAYARVVVTVPGKYDNQSLGLYSLVENVDKNFLGDRGLDRGGAIFKPSTPNLFADLGDDWKAYQQTYDPKTDLTAAQQRRIIDLCRLVTRANDVEFAARLGDYIDLDEFARFLAVSVWIGDLDSLLTAGQNYYLYLDPKSGRIQFIPWDKDHTYGSFGGRDLADREQHSIREPWEGPKRFLERVFQVESFRDRYLAALTRFNQEQGQPAKFASRMAALAAIIRPAVQAESAQQLARFDLVQAGKPVPGGMPGFGGPPPSSILPFVQARVASVTDQLAGRAPGRVLGKPRPGQADEPPFQPQDLIEPVLRKALDTDRNQTLTRAEWVSGFASWFTAWSAGPGNSLTEAELRKGLNQALPFPNPFGAPPGEAGPRDAGPGPGAKF